MRHALSSLCLVLAAGTAQAQCGGSFSSFLSGFKQEAVARGHSAANVDRFLANARQDQKVLNADRAQGIFRMNFTDFARRVISANRMQNGQRNAQKYASTFASIQRQYGVPKGILLAFWALETDYGQVQGDFNTLNALLTLAHDCRRPELFRPQAFAALTLYERGDFDPVRTTGAWAGEIGQVQMLPADILENGVDGDGNGHVDLKGSSVDALHSGAKMLRSLGWRPNEPWLQEVTVPSNLDWSKSGLDHQLSTRDWARMGVKPRQGDLAGLPASLLLPEGRNGPAFLAYPNFRVLFEWNQSFVYVTTAAYFATRLEGAPVFAAGNPSPPLSGNEMVALQKKLAARGHDVGGIDGILGEKTREAVQKEQIRLGLPADAWPTRDLLNRL
ncbi:lytic murein transglycosylase [Mangrovicoccus sp. HB161399]|uniref:lytic murein transglycosylase n=1 Tax=Mangrovicoccus sp. HB161399 TaxID=2720392 RepID=UPI00155352D1|nr:lytic murein transglycosylase [Mangrovicoccus sp. HB161399]